MRSKKITWQRSEEGYTDSHCGRFSIVPLCCGTTRPQYYDLFWLGEDGKQYKKICGFEDTQKSCKEQAEDYVKPKAKRPIITHRPA